MAREPLEGDAALVTGASSGIGEATACVLAADGADVALAARREERLEEIAAEIESAYGIEALVVPTDVTDDEQVDAMVERAVDALGGLDLVVGNAGVNRFASIGEMPTETYRDMLSVNVDGAFFTARAAIPHLRETEGTLVFVGSMSGEYPGASQPVYTATKWFVRGFALSLAGALGDDGVAVTVVNPSEVRTEIGKEDGRPATERYADLDAPEPVDVAEAIAFAARQEPPVGIPEISLYRRDKLA